MAASQGQAEVKGRFLRNFQDEVKALQEQMDRLKDMSVAGGERNDAVDRCLADIDRLSHEVKDAFSYLPAYDQRTHSETIKALSDKLQSVRNSFNPPKKFTFKKRKNASAISNDTAELVQSQKPPASTLPDTLDATLAAVPTPPARLSLEEEKPQRVPLKNIDEDVDDGIIAGTGIRRPSFSKATNVTISKHEGLRIILPTSASHATSSGTVANLKRCVVDLSPPTANGAPFAALYLKNIKDSLVICGRVAGAIHITNIENSVIVAACQQFRMHGSRNVDIYLHSASRPIFEDCEGLRFAPLPDVYTTPAISQTVNQWVQIDDFKWLKAEPSPHFSILAETERIRDDVWRNTIQGGDSLGVDDILRAVNTR